MLHPQRVYAYSKSIGSRYMQFIPLVERAANKHRNAGASAGRENRSNPPRQWTDYSLKVPECHFDI